MFCNYPPNSYFVRKKYKNYLTFKMSNDVVYCLKITAFFCKNKRQI